MPGPRVSKRKRRSLVEQVREGLLEDLIGGHLEPGTKLPNETEIAERFTVSRATVREAVLGLIDAGYLVRRHGSGTYVTAAPRVRHALETTFSYSAMIREAGHEPGEKVLSKGVRDPTELERERLDLQEHEPLMAVERVRLADRRPVVYSRDRIPCRLLDGLTGEALDSSLYEILESAGHPVARARAQLIPTVADARLAKVLATRRGTPLLHLDQVDYDDRGRPVMLSHEWHVADAFELVVNRRAATAALEA
jgi:GntR family transcriptional regulator